MVVQICPGLHEAVRRLSQKVVAAWDQAKVKQELGMFQGSAGEDAGSKIGLVLSSLCTKLANKRWMAKGSPEHTTAVVLGKAAAFPN